MCGHGGRLRRSDILVDWLNKTAVGWYQIFKMMDKGVRENRPCIREGFIKIKIQKVLSSPNPNA